MTDKKMIELALEARSSAYAPYSNFKVGAALQAKSGKVFTGSNIENASYPAGICAERVALSKAVSEGEKDFEKIAIVGSGNSFSYPCGICRQSLNEFSPKMEVIVATDTGVTEKTTLDKLLPSSFGPKNLQ